MKKKILICLLAVLALCTLTGCGKEKCKGDKCNNTKKPVVQEFEKKTKIGDQEILLDTEAEFFESKFKYASTANYQKLDAYTMIDETKDGILLYRVGLYYFEDMPIYEVMADTSLEENGSIEVNKNKWIRYTGFEDDKRLDMFIINKNNSTYTVNFSSDYDDIELFIGDFLSTIEF